MDVAVHSLDPFLGRSATCTPLPTSQPSHLFLLFFQQILLSTIYDPEWSFISALTCVYYLSAQDDIRKQDYISLKPQNTARVSKLGKYEWKGYIPVMKTYLMRRVLRDIYSLLEDVIYKKNEIFVAMFSTRITWRYNLKEILFLWQRFLYEWLIH